jgi:2-polyprenyl-6-methoxyphenol hydroxylase-like FAD-dependent oxidoreductase
MGRAAVRHVVGGRVVLLQALRYVRVMRFVVAGGGAAGLAAALAVARAGHEATVLERDAGGVNADPMSAFAEPRRGIPHFFQPHTFLPRGRRVLERVAPDVLAALLEAGAETQDVAARLHGPSEPGDEDLVYVWVRRPVIEWALRRAAVREPGIDLRSGVRIAGLVTEDSAGRAAAVALEGGATVVGDVVVDALGRYRPPAGWRRPFVKQADCGALYYCRYFRLRDDVDHLDGGPRNPLNPRGDLGYMGFNTFRGDNRTYAVILLVPTLDRQLRVLREERAWMAACASMRPLDVMTSGDYGVPITDVMPMGGLLNVDCTGDDEGVSRRVAVGDALCHTDPAFAYGLSFALAHAEALARAAGQAGDADELVERYRGAVIAEARERFVLARDTDDARTRRWNGEPLDISRRDGCYPLFAFAAALAAAPADDLVLRRTIRRIGLLDRTDVFDNDRDLHERIEAILASPPADSPPPAGPPRDELLARINAAAA